jgi:hypothetical protein
MIKKLLMVPLIAVAFFTLTGFDMKDSPEWESASYGGTIHAISATEEAIYIGGETTQTVQALNPSDGSIIWESPDYGGSIQSISATSEAIYIGGETTQTVQALNPSDGSIIWESPDYGVSITVISATEETVYIGGETTQTVQAYEMIEPTFIETVFGVVSGVIVAGISVFTALFSGIVSILYTPATETTSGSLTMLGIVSLLAFGFLFTKWGFRFILNMIKRI